MTAYAIQAGALRENPNSGPDGVGVQADIAYTLEARAEVQAVVTDTLRQAIAPRAIAKPQAANDNQPLRFLSVCSGIEAASVAWPQWRAVAFSEIEKFPSAVLAHHYPDTPNLGDFTKIDTTALGRVDILCGGTPCQAFSVAGLRRSLDDARGNLSLAFVELAHELAGLGSPNGRATKGNGLRNVVWENVVGVLSTKDNAFGCFLGGLVGADGPIVPPGRWTNAGMVSGPKGRAAWRVLDAQYFGVAQRRRRVIVVADFGNGADPATVLFEPEGVRRHSPPSRETGEGVAPTISARTKGGGGLGTDFDLDGGLVRHAVDVAPCMRAGGNATGGDRPYGTDVDTADSLVAYAFGAQNSANQGDSVSRHITPTLDKSKIPAVTVAIRGREGGATAELGGEVATALRTSQGGRDKPHVLSGTFATSAVRRLTPLECERLQGFPEVKKTLYIRAWKQNSFDHHQSYVTAEIQSHRSPKSASNADANASMSSAQNAASPSNASHPECEKLVDVHALINFERNDLLLRSPRNSNWSVNIAEHLNSSLLSMPIGDFVRLIAHIFTIQEKIAHSGRAASQASTRNSLDQRNGRPLNVPYGHERGVSASDVALFMKELDAFMKSITSKAGCEIATLEQRLQTSLFFATSVISSCIPATISTESSFSLTIEGVRGYTNIPWRNSHISPDGPRYKALGNSWAVPLFTWLGRRIDAHMPPIAANTNKDTAIAHAA